MKKKKFGFDGTNYRPREGGKPRGEDADLRDKLTASFKEATRAAAEAAWAENLPVPGAVKGRLMNVLPNGKVVEFQIEVLIW